MPATTPSSPRRSSKEEDLYRSGVRSPRSSDGSQAGPSFPGTSTPRREGGRGAHDRHGCASPRGFLENPARFLLTGFRHRHEGTPVSCPLRVVLAPWTRECPFRALDDPRNRSGGNLERPRGGRKRGCRIRRPQRPRHHHPPARGGSHHGTDPDPDHEEPLPEPPSWLRPAARPPSCVAPPRRYSPPYRRRRRALSGGASLGLGPTNAYRNRLAGRRSSRPRWPRPGRSDRRQAARPEAGPGRPSGARRAEGSGRGLPWGSESRRPPRFQEDSCGQGVGFVL